MRSSVGLVNRSSGAPSANAALIEETDPVGNLPRKTHFVCNRQHGQIMFPSQLGDNIEHFAHKFRIERRCALVEHQDIGMHGQGPDNANALWSW